MWSGKSRALIGQLELGRIAHIQVLLVRPTKDTRKVRSGSEFTGDTIFISGASAIFDHVLDAYEWIGFDEAQFFEEDLIDVIKQLLRMEKRVLVAGLDLDFREEPFVVVAKMMSLANDVHKLKAVCAQCRSLEGTRSQRLTDNQTVEEVGGEDKYEPRCFRCFVPPNGVVHSSDSMRIDPLSS